MANLIAKLFSSPVAVFTAAFLLRAVLLVYGLWQDANSPLKYTDIDYLVFTDAARLTFSPPSSSFITGPYARETYRYTPLLAWLLYPTTLPGIVWFSSGKVLFAAADLAAGWFLVRILRRHMGMSTELALKYAGIWLLNPMVATISTRGSSEGLLGALVTALLYAVLERQVDAAAFLLGLGVHFKIYPFIYAPAIVWWMDETRMKAGASTSSRPPTTYLGYLRQFTTAARIRLALISLATFTTLNVSMYILYGEPFLQHTFLHHVTRIDHRHNFSPYNVLLYLTSAEPYLALDPSQGDGWTGTSFLGQRIESIAFAPQLLLSCVLIPLIGAKKDLATTMLAQTFAFVTFNKVCTSQYFLWYMVLLPLYLPRSSFMRSPVLGVAALALWIVTQGLWLQQGYNLEFLGQSTFVPGLFYASLAFFLVNCWILGVIIGDFGDSQTAIGDVDSTTKRAVAQ